MLPLLRELNPRFDTAAARAAALLRADEDFLESLARDFLRENADENGPLRRRARRRAAERASRAVRILAPCALSEAHVDAVLALAEGEGAAFADVPGARCARQNGRLRFFTSLPGAIEPRVLRAGEEFALPESGLYVKCSDSVYSGEINSSFNTFFFPYANICGTIYSMSGQPGDKLRNSAPRLHEKTLRPLRGGAHPRAQPRAGARFSGTMRASWPFTAWRWPNGPRRAPARGR